MILTKEELERLGCEAKVEKIEDPALGTFYVRQVTVKEYDALQVIGGTVIDTVNAGKPFRSRAVAWFLCDETGARLYGDNEISKIERLNGKLVDVIFTAGWKFNALGDDDAKSEIERLEKNSDATP